MDFESFGHGVQDGRVIYPHPPRGAAIVGGTVTEGTVVGGQGE
jgi:hypothetical protein